MRKLYLSDFHRTFIGLSSDQCRTIIGPMSVHYREMADYLGLEMTSLNFEIC